MFTPQNIHQASQQVTQQESQQRYTPPISQPPKLTQAQREWEEAKNWFNNMDQSNRNHFILAMYRLCLNTKDVSHNKLAESINSQWEEKFSVELEKSKKLQMENEVYRKHQEQHVTQLDNTIRNLEMKVSESVNSIALKITPSSNGQLGENYIESVLGKIPGSTLTNVSQSKGGGDFLYTQGDVRIMIESKNWTNSSIKGNPKELEKFKNTAIASKEEGDIDYAVMALHRVTDLKGKAISMETVYTRKGRLMLIYITNLFNHPDRLLYAIDSGILLLQHQNQSSVESDKFLYQVDNFMKNIESIEESIKERSRLIKDMSNIAKRDVDTVNVLRQTLENIIHNSDKLPMKDRVISYCWELIMQNDKDPSNVNKVMLEQKLKENNIPARWVREYGGIKTIKKWATDKYNSEN